MILCNQMCDGRTVAQGPTTEGGWLGWPAVTCIQGKRWAFNGRRSRGCGQGYLHSVCVCARAHNVQAWVGFVEHDRHVSRVELQLLQLFGPECWQTCQGRFYGATCCSALTLKLSSAQLDDFLSGFCLTVLAWKSPCAWGV